MTSRPRTRASFGLRPTGFLALAVAALVSSAPARAQTQPPTAQPVDAVTGLLRAFDTHRLVAVGEEHGDVPLHRVLRALVRHPRFPQKARVVVVEFASASHQRTLDRFIRGDRVAARELQAVWRDSVGGGALGVWDAPIYRQFLATVRAVNQRLPANRRIRVVAGDPPVDWRTVDTPAEADRVGRSRDPHYASVVDRYVMRRNARALLISGALHFDREKNAIARNVASYIDARYPGALFVAMQPPTENVEPFVRGWRTPSLALVKGTSLGAVRSDVPPEAPFVPSALEERTDALLYVTPFGLPGHFSKPYPSSWRDREWREMWRRLRLGGDHVHEHVLFESACIYGEFQGRGLRQRSREAGLRGEPAALGNPAPLDPAPRHAIEAVLATLDSKRVVFLGEAPSLDQEHAWIRSLIEAPGFAEKVRNVVVAFGNARHQRTLDAYLRGGTVRRSALVRVWRDTTQLLVWDAQMYAQFFTLVRRVNSSLPADRRVRVWLGEPPFDWRNVRGPRDISGVARRQPAFMARLVDRALARGERVLVVAPRSLVTRSRGSVRSLVDRTNPNASFSVLPHVGFAAGQRELEARLKDWLPGSLAAVPGTWLGSLRAGRNNAQAEWRRPLGALADAYLYLGPRSSLTASGPLPSTYRDGYWRAVLKRHLLVFGRPLEERTAFPTSNCRRPSARVGDPEPPRAQAGARGAVRRLR